MQTFRGRTTLWLVASLLTSACADRALLAPQEEARPGPALTAPTLTALHCTVDVAARTVGCSDVTASTAGANRDYVVGGQGQNVRLTSTNASYDAGTQTLGVDVTVQNLMADALGTVDGTTLSANGVKVFFATEPTLTSGTGAVALQNPDGVGMFTESDQAYFQYPQVLALNAVSSPRRWLFTVGPTATFAFTVYVSAPVQARLVVSEIMANPAIVVDNFGEWIEVYNAGRTDVDLAGWKVVSNGTQSHVITPGAATCGVAGCSLVVPRGGYVVLSNNRNTATNGGVPVDYQWPDGTGSGQINLAQSGLTEFIALASPGGVEVDRVTWNSTNATATSPSGISRCLTDLAADNSLLTDPIWQQSTAAWSGSAGDKGTPKAPNSGCGNAPAAGPIVTVLVSPSTSSVAVGATRQFTASGRDANGVTATTTFTWTIDNPAIASINATTGVVLGNAAGSTTLHAMSANGVSGSATIAVTQEFTSAVYRNHVEFGVPFDGNSADDIIITRPQYELSYSDARGGPNWVSWNLNKTHFGAAERCDCFTVDPLLPAGTKQVSTGDYTGSGYSRGHMVMSEQRTTTDAENLATFYTTNILPQQQDMNGGPWLKFENQNSDLARLSNKELYIISGGIFPASPATLNNAGKVQIPTSTWKIAVVLDSGKTLADVHTTADLQVYAVNMPNVTGIIGQPWQAYITTVDAIEAATGYNFLDLLPDAIENAVEASAYSPSPNRIPLGVTALTRHATPAAGKAPAAVRRPTVGPVRTLLH